MISVSEWKGHRSSDKRYSGITGLSRQECIDDAVWHLDVGSSHPGAGEGPKGSAVRRSIAVRELGSDRREQVGLYRGGRRTLEESCS